MEKHCGIADDGLEVRSTQTIAAKANTVVAGWVIFGSPDADVVTCYRIIGTSRSELVALATTETPT